MAASRIRDEGGVAIRGTTTLGRQNGPIDGKIRYAPYAVDSKLTVAASPTELAEVRYLRKLDDAWIKGQTRTTSTTASLNSALLLYRTAGRPPYLAITNPDEGVGTHLSAPFDPARLLDRLAAAKVEFTTVNSAGQRRYEAKLPRALALATGVQTVSVEARKRNQPTSVQLTSVEGARSEYDIRPFRGTLSVEAPSAELVETTGTPPPDATGPYVAVATLTVGSTAIEIGRADADRGWECWNVTSTPPFTSSESPRPSGGFCSVKVNDNSDDEAYTIPLDAGPDVPFELLGIVFPPGTQATITTLSGTKPMAVSPEGLAYFAGPTDDVALLVEATTPAGRVLVCGPGSINNKQGTLAVERAGADTPDPVFGDTVRAQPWNCLPQELADALGSPGAG